MSEKRRSKQYIGLEGFFEDLTEVDQSQLCINRSWKLLMKICVFLAVLSIILPVIFP